jgi:hypothetical protein
MFLLLFQLIILSPSARAQTPVDRAAVVRLIESVQFLPLHRRIEVISEKFLGHKYLLGPLGEGSHGSYNRNPLYRFDVFDCTTFVETMISLSRASDFGSFERNMNEIRYNEGRVSFTRRNHFPELDWIPNNNLNGILREISDQVSGHLVSQARALIDKPGWYAHLGPSAIVIPQLSDTERAESLSRLRQEGSRFKPEVAITNYLSIASVLASNFGLRLLDRIPSGAVINIVRPNWDLTRTEGTHLNNSHQGLAIRKNGTLFFRNASSATGVNRVVDAPMTEYLRKLVGHPTIKGINIQDVVGP